ncbi:MAG: hypothetical protein IT381_00985 [Deltaproteobacteria bacterium]|nr:hypothetical protein [Deltaproteobacteria bacterium]
MVRWLILLSLLGALSACPGKPWQPPIVAVEPDTESEADPDPVIEPPTTPAPPNTAKPDERPEPPPPKDKDKPKPAKRDPPASKPARAKKVEIDPDENARKAALASLRVPFVAKQHIVYKTADDTKESTGELTVYPGKGYRLKITGPLGIVALDVKVRCNKYSYHVPLKLKHLRGPLAQAIKDIPYFPIAAIFSMFDPNLDGTWRGRTFVASKERLKTKMHKTLPALVEWGVIDGNDQPIVMRILAFSSYDDGVYLPQRFHMTFSDGRTIDLEAETISREPPPEDEVLESVECP